MIDGHLTADEAATHLGITRRTLYNLAASRADFPLPTHVGRTPLWPTAALDAWRANHPARRKSRSEPPVE